MVQGATGSHTQPWYPHWGRQWFCSDGSTNLGLIGTGSRWKAPASHFPFGHGNHGQSPKCPHHAPPMMPACVSLLYPTMLICKAAIRTQNASAPPVVTEAASPSSGPLGSIIPSEVLTWDLRTLKSLKLLANSWDYLYMHIWE